MTLKRWSTFLLLGSAGALAHARPPGVTLPDVLLDELRRSSGIVGMSAAIARDGKLAWHGESGVANAATNAPVTPRTEFRLGSVSKFVTIAMLGRLLDQRQIDLQRPVSAYLPTFPAEPHSFNSLQLATHTAGMGHYKPGVDDDIDGRAQPYATVSESLALFQERPLLHAPGSSYQYSSFGYNLLSAAMEKAGQRDFLSMLASTAREAGAPSLQAERMGTTGPHWSALYDTAGHELPRQNITYKWAGGGMLANASDLAMFGVKTLDPGFISPATYKLLTTPATLANGDIIRNGRVVMGLGWRLSTDHAGRDYVHHAGAIPGGRAMLGVYPGAKASVALLGNVQASLAAEFTAEALYDAFTGPQTRGRCLQGRGTFTGVHAKDSFSGIATLTTVKGFCKAVFTLGGELAKRIAPGSNSVQMSAISRSADGPVYLVTPVGIYTGETRKNALVAPLLGASIQITLQQ